MFLLRLQINEFHQIMVENGLQPNEFTFKIAETEYSLRHHPYGCYFTLKPLNETYANYKVQFSPDLSDSKYSRVSGATKLLHWREVVALYKRWTQWANAEISAPDLWAEAAKTAQLFAPTAEPTDDKFTRPELAEVRGQLRQLQQRFTQAALPEAAKQKLMALTQTAAIKAETSPRRTGRTGLWAASSGPSPIWI